MRFLAILSSLLFPLCSQASEGIDINKLKERSIMEIQKNTPKYEG
jgi:hypothetical protein